MNQEREIDDKIVDWISKFAKYLESDEKKQKMLTFLARRIAFERWLVPEFGFFIKDEVRNFSRGNEVFFELGGKERSGGFDLIICPPEEAKVSTNLLRYLEENGLVIEFKAGTRDRERNLIASTLVGEIEGCLKKLKEDKVKHSYLISFLYCLSASEGNPFLRGGWYPLDHDKLNDQFDEMRMSAENEIKCEDIEPLHHNQNLSLTFGDANISGKATFLIYKVNV